MAALVGFAAAWVLTPGKFATTAIVHLSSRNPRTGYVENEEFLNFQRTQVATLKSYDVLNRLIVKPEIAELSEMQNHQGSELEWLQKDLVVDTLMGPEILRVTLSGDYPEDLEKILNALIPIYKEKFDSDELDKVNRQIERLRANLKETERDLKKDGQLTDGPGRDLKTLVLRQMDLQQKITTLQIQIGQLQSAMRKDVADMADFERKKSKPELLVDPYELLQAMNQNDRIRPLRELILAKETEIQKLQRGRLLCLRRRPFCAEALERLKDDKAALEKEIDNAGSGIASSVREGLEKRALQRLSDSFEDSKKSLALKKKDEEEFNRELMANMAANDEVRMQIFTQRNREDRQRDTGMPKEMLIKKIATELSELESSKSASSRVEFKERAQVPTARKLDRKLKFAGGSLGVAGRLCRVGCIPLQSSTNAAFTRPTIKWRAALASKVIGTLPYSSRITAARFPTRTRLS